MRNLSASQISEIPTVAELALPDWASRTFITSLQGKLYRTDLEKIGLAIELARRNVENKSGGPFGAAIFGEDDQLISIGVNRVVPQTNPTAHAEMVAIQLAASKLRSFNLTGVGKITLATSAQPCAMCCGAIPWAGVSRLLIGATAGDTESMTGFDEGPIHPAWQSEYAKRGIDVVQEIMRGQARDVFTLYASNNGVIYNGNSAGLSDLIVPPNFSASREADGRESHGVNP